MSVAPTCAVLGVSLLGTTSILWSIGWRPAPFCTSSGLRLLGVAVTCIMSKGTGRPICTLTTLFPVTAGSLLGLRRDCPLTFGMNQKRALSLRLEECTTRRFVSLLTAMLVHERYETIIGFRGVRVERVEFVKIEQLPESRMP